MEGDRTETEIEAEIVKETEIEIEAEVEIEVGTKVGIRIDCRLAIDAENPAEKGLGVVVEVQVAAVVEV